MLARSFRHHHCIIYFPPFIWGGIPHKRRDVFSVVNTICYSADCASSRSVFFLRKILRLCRGYAWRMSNLSCRSANRHKIYLLSTVLNVACYTVSMYGCAYIVGTFILLQQCILASKFLLKSTLSEVGWILRQYTSCSLSIFCSGPFLLIRMAIAYLSPSITQWFPTLHILLIRDRRKLFVLRHCWTIEKTTASPLLKVICMFSWRGSIPLEFSKPNNSIFPLLFLFRRYRLCIFRLSHQDRLYFYNHIFEMFRKPMSLLSVYNVHRHFGAKTLVYSASCLKHPSPVHASHLQLNNFPPVAFCAKISYWPRCAV